MHLWERSIFIPGRPRGKGNKRRSPAGGLYEPPDCGLAAWTRRATAALQLCAPPRPWDGPCELDVIDFVPRPKSHHVGGNPQGPLKGTAPGEPFRGIFPDGDKALRATADALQPPLRAGKEGGRWIVDDRVIVSWRFQRVWCVPEGRSVGRRVIVRGLPGRGMFDDVTCGRHFWSRFNGDFEPTDAEIDARIEEIKAENLRKGVLKAAETRRRRRLDDEGGEHEPGSALHGEEVRGAGEEL